MARNLGHFSRTASPGRRPSWALVRRLLALGTLVAASMLSPLWLSSTPAVGQGAFEPFGNSITLRYGNRIDESVEPISIHATGKTLAVAPGTTVVVALEPDVELSILGPDPHRLAWLLIGNEAPDVVPQRVAPKVVNRGHRLAAPQSLARDDAGLTSVPWQPVPFRTDDQRLRDLVVACGGQDATVRIRLTQGVPEVSVGRCHTRLHAGPVGPTVQSWRVAVAGEAEGAILERSRGSWPVQRELRTIACAAILGCCVVQVLALGGLVSGVLSLACAVGCWLFPGFGAFAWLTLALVAAVLLVVRWSKAAGARSGRWGKVLAFGIPVVLGAAVVIALFFPHDNQEFDVPRADGQMTCLLLGYSTANDNTLPDPSYGVLATLNQQSAKCRAQSGRWTDAGGTFGWFGTRLCSDKIPAETHEIVFLGGSNDDLIRPSGRLQELRTILLLVLMMMDTPNPGHWKRTIELASINANPAADQGISEIATGVDCARRRGSHFVYLADFLAMDLLAGRGPLRAGHVAKRRRAVEQGGGRVSRLVGGTRRRSGCRVVQRLHSLLGRRPPADRPSGGDRAGRPSAGLAHERHNPAI